jgi:FAD/FMN-containing dehydrogenase
MSRPGIPDESIRDRATRDAAKTLSLKTQAGDTFRRIERVVTGNRKPEWLSRLPRFKGEVVLADEALDLAELDFGKVRRLRPAAVLRPADTDDIVEAVRFCRREKLPLAPRGCAHSAGGQMMVADGLVLDMKSMNRILELTDRSCLVEAGIQWGALLTAAVERGLTPPIVTDWLGVSVGGTLSMGGFGFMSFRRGTQMDNLLELEVVTGAGERVVCSREHNPELFDIVRGTHGKFGIITRARIPLEPAPPKVRMVQACYGSARAMLNDLERFTVSQEADLLHAFAAEKSARSIRTKMNSTEEMSLDSAAVDAALRRVEGRWVFNLELVDLLTPGRTRPLIDTRSLACEPGLVDTWELTWRDFCFRLPPLIIEEQLRGAAPHPELCMWTPMNDAGKALVEREYRRLRPLEDTGNGPMLFFPVQRALVTPSLFPMPEGHPYCFFWGLLRRADPATPSVIAEQVADNEVLYQRGLALGAVRYLPDTPPDSPAFWAAHFGPRWPRIQALKTRFDPDGILTSSFGSAALSA